MMQTETVFTLLEGTRQQTSLIESVRPMREVQEYAKSRDCI